jgi:chaperonin GroEL (HSP60 family)
MELESGAVLQVVGASLRSLLGPERSAKMCIFESEEEESGGKGLIVTDSMQVLSALIDQIQHPAGHVIHEAALGHHGNHGCGVTSLVCLAASWSQQVAELRKQGYPLPVVFAVFEECLRESEAAILNLCQPLTKMRDEYSRSLFSLSLSLSPSSLPLLLFPLFRVARFFCTYSSEHVRRKKGKPIILSTLYPPLFSFLTPPSHLYILT